MRQRFSHMGVGAIIALIAIIGAVGLGLFLQHEKNRTTHQWREKLDLIADARSREVGGFIQGQFRELSALADNASLQIYFTQLQGKNAPAAQGEYLRNLLTLTSQRLGLEPESQTISQQLGANVRQLGTGGLALVDGDGKMLMATAGMPPIEGAILGAVKAAPRGEQTLVDIMRNENGSQRLGFIIPIYGIQAEQNAASQIGSLVALRTLGGSFFDLLSVQPAPEETLEVALVRKEDGAIRYLTPLLDKSPVMSRTEEDSAAHAGAFALANKNSFAEKTDYRGKEVLVSSRAVPSTPWALLAKIDRDEAMAAANAWRNTVASTIILLLVALAAIIIAVWRHATAREQASLAAESGARAQLLSVVTDNQPEPIYIVDAQANLWFVNRPAAEAMRINARDIRGKALANVIGTSSAQAIAAACSKALTSGSAQAEMLERVSGDAKHAIYTRCVPLEHIPVEGVPHPTAGVLVVEQDMTDIIREREMRMNTLNQLVAMLVSLVDKRDPNAAEHSARVAELATHTAKAMGLSNDLVDTTSIAARLMNLGKVDIPAELLTRDGKLNQAERDAIRSSLATSADLLKGIAFNGPVADTLRQSQEHVDGTGPMKLKGEGILMPARIIAAANALVGMLSPRSYRPAMPFDEAIKLLQGDIETHFDRKVISAMVHYLENQGGRENIAPHVRKIG